MESNHPLKTGPMSFEELTRQRKEMYGEDSVLGAFYESTENQINANIHLWRSKSLPLLIPMHYHHDVAFFLRNLREMEGDEPPPMPFDEWGLDPKMIKEAIIESPTATIVSFSAKGEEASAGFTRTHTLIYGRRIISELTYTVLPFSKSCEAKGTCYLPLWAAPTTLPRWPGRDLSELRIDHNVFWNLSANSAVSWAETYPPAEKLRFLATNQKTHPRLAFITASKTGSHLIETDPSHEGAVPMWAVGKIPRR